MTDVVKEAEKIADGIASADTLLTASEILAADDMIYEIVDVPEWRGKVRVKALTATERDSFEASMITGQGKNQRFSTADIRAKLVARAVVDAEGNRVFTDFQIAQLGTKSAAAMDRVYEVAARLSKISSADVDELAGKSDSAPADAS